ncbi:hypothetical protein [Microtetraspora sp. NBRC 16547]|uniref:hypothetical protein n=1 Tax=Microtetraspora sp. NBRC 16547 TaxID=3030993 RepID=UPI00249FD71F|nr:hypothetical protein [Microtetraspora sp. NBRC 16547]GLW99244.1 hypothetical protein Misp02_33310 [Microtetraspora sp. NBRC 16547]
MGSVVPLGLVALLVPVAGLLAVLISLNRVVRVPVGTDLSALRVTTTRLFWARLAGLVAGLAASGLVLSWDGLGRGPMLAAPVLSIGLLLGTLAGELAAPRPHGPIRGASLEIRRARDYLPRFSAWLAGALSLVAAVLLSVTSVTASADDMGRAGRALAMSSPDGTVRSVTGPWPGWFYAWPMLAVLATAFLLSALVVHRVVQRGRPGLDVAARAVDDAQRAHSARVVTAAYGLCVALPLIGVALVAAEALFRHSDFAGWVAPAASGLLGVALFAAGSATWYLAELLSRPTIRPS